jgi:hypothetical protein
MIVNLYVAVDLAIAFLALVVGSYTAFKAYKVQEGAKGASGDRRYELEKDYYLVSTVGWMTLGTRVLAIPLFFVTVISLIPSVPGAMCEFGVFQAGAPFSWADLGLKLFTIFAFGGWLFFDLINRKLKHSPFMGDLSSSFILLMPLLFIDAGLDIAFFGSLKPLVVPCCMVIYQPNSLFSGCPFCLVTYKMPLLMAVIPSFALALALVIWSFLFKRHSKKLVGQEDSSPMLAKALKASIALSIVGMILLIIQLAMGPLGTG